MTLHTAFDPEGGQSYLDTYRAVAKDYAALAPLDEDNFLCSFGHIFAGGYSAGYYSYKWSEVLSADCFGAFEEAGLDDDAKVVELGQRFRDTFLKRGGGEHPMDVFVDFHAYARGEFDPRFYPASDRCFGITDWSLISMQCW